MIEIEALHDGITTDLRREDLMNSGTSTPPKREQISMWHYREFPPKQWRMY